MTIAELLVTLCLLVLLMRVLRPLQRRIEFQLIKMLGGRGPTVIEGSVVRPKDKKY